MSWYQPPPFEPVVYIPASRKDATLASQVQCIHVAAHNPESWGNKLTNHWALYLVTGPSSLVRIDCAPSGQAGPVAGGDRANIVVSELKCPVSNNAVHNVTLQTPPDLTVANVINSLINSGRHRYEFHPEGVGCRKWIMDQMNLLAELQYGDAANCQAAIQDLFKIWPAGTDLDMKPGSYYQE
jgi:hypothetical protein